LFAGLASGTMVVAEDDGCHFIGPSNHTGGVVWYRHPNVNNGLPYWETPANIEAREAADAAAAAKPAPAEAPPPRDKPPGEPLPEDEHLL
jgi:hypothetical protein